MFGFGKKEEKISVEEVEIDVKGKVARLGASVANEYRQRYVILLDGDKKAYISDRSNKGFIEGDVVALTQPGDMVEFKIKKGYLNIIQGSFVNKTLAEQGYIPAN